MEGHCRDKINNTGNTGSTFPSQKSSVTVRVNLPLSPPCPQPKHSQRIHRETEKKQDVLLCSVPVSQQAPAFLACSQAPPQAPRPLLPPLPTQLTGPGCRPGTGFPPPCGSRPAIPGMFRNSPPSRPPSRLWPRVSVICPTLGKRKLRPQEASTPQDHPAPHLQFKEHPHPPNPWPHTGTRRAGCWRLKVWIRNPDPVTKGTLNSIRRGEGLCRSQNSVCPEHGLERAQ